VVFISGDQASGEVDLAFGMCFLAAVNGEVSEVHGLAECSNLFIPPLGIGVKVGAGRMGGVNDVVHSAHRIGRIP
jgi:hypothetical protein